MSFPEIDLTKEKAEEIIERIASYSVSKGYGEMLIIALESTRPLWYLGSQLSLIGEPFFFLIPKNWGYNLVGLFSNEQYVKNLIKRIEQLIEEEKQKEKKEKEERMKKAEGKRSLRSLFKLHAYLPLRICLVLSI